MKSKWWEKQFKASKDTASQVFEELHSCSCHQQVCAAISTSKKQVAGLTKCVERHRLFCPTHNFFAPRVNNGIPCPLLIALFHGRERNIASPYYFEPTSILDYFKGVQRWLNKCFGRVCQYNFGRISLSFSNLWPEEKVDWFKGILVSDSSSFEFPLPALRTFPKVKSWPCDLLICRFGQFTNRIKEGWLHLVTKSARFQSRNSWWKAFYSYSSLFAYYCQALTYWLQFVWLQWCD